MTSKFENLKMTLTWEEWKQLGQLLCKCQSEITRSATKKHDPLDKYVRATANVRSLLDDIVFYLFSEKDTQILAHVMYPGTESIRPHRGQGIVQESR